MNEIRISDAAYRRVRVKIAKAFVRAAVANQGDAYSAGQLSGLHTAFMTVPGATETEWCELCSEQSFRPVVNAAIHLGACA